MPVPRTASGHTTPQKPVVTVHADEGDERNGDRRQSCGDRQLGTDAGDEPGCQRRHEHDRDRARQQPDPQSRGRSGPGRTGGYCVRRKMAPKSAKNVTAIAPLAALKRGLAQNFRSSIGCSTRASHVKKAMSATAAIAKTRRVLPLVQPSLGASITAYSSAHRPTMERIAPTQSSRGAWGSRESGIRKLAREQTERDDGQVHQEDRAPVEVLEQEPAGDGTECDANPRGCGPDGDRLRTFVCREHVRDDRQRGGMISAAPTPMTARVAIN